MIREKGIKRMEKFNEKVEKLVLKYGATNNEYFYKWKIETKGGALLIDVHRPIKTALFSIFTCFDDPTKAKDELGGLITFNHYSGKCNFHITDEQECLKEFEGFLKLITK